MPNHTPEEGLTTTNMNPEIKKKCEHLVFLKSNPMADVNNIYRLQKELELINIAQFSKDEIQLLNQATH